MPNIVTNHVLVTGKDGMVDMFVRHMATPFTYKMLEAFTTKIEERIDTSPFNFFNVIAPPQTIMDEYAQQPKRGSLDVKDPNWWNEQTDLMKKDNSWYHWNTRNWGTKWNAMDPTMETLSQETLGRTRVLYKFDTAWQEPEPVFEQIARSWPSLNLYIRVVSEEGWGAKYQYKEGSQTVYKFFDNARSDFLDKLLKS